MACTQIHLNYYPLGNVVNSLNDLTSDRPMSTMAVGQTIVNLLKIYIVLGRIEYCSRNTNPRK